MSITIEIEGLDDVARMIKQIGAKAEAEVAKAVTTTALEVNTNVKKLIQRGPKTGRVYERGSGRNLSATHQASAPGEAPATDTGALVSSVYFQQDDKLSATVGSRLAYAYYLEFGTARMAARPSWLPATEAAAPKLAKRITDGLARAVQ